MRILVVEDERSLAQMVADRLKRDKYTVDVSNDGEEGLYNALSGIYDLIILDIMLPHVDGIEILKEVRKSDHDVKIIMLTAKAELEDRLTGFGLGANDYVPKPFHIEELAARVNAQLSIGKAMSDTLDYADLTLNYKTSSISSGRTDESITVNNKEFQLLEYFMSNPERILSKEMIYDHIWGMDSDAMSNNLEAYMSFVRKKLKLIGSEVSIRTVRNMGYSMEREK
ncbi:MAG: response regulator transcription factor [Lachnospiraceae bacterium]|jgi:DNA-binding response OmpR family regulator|nr:response regulator transcription factor [Lachnospiraceae bacterium]